MIDALVNMGAPPSGLGLYARDHIEPGAWDFVAVNYTRSDREAQAAEVRRMGAQLWLYATPEHFHPSNWRASLGAMVAEATRLGAAGVIADFEGGWDGPYENEARLAGAALAEAAKTVRVCFTSYYSWRFLDALLSTAGRAISGNLQIYGRTEQDAEVWERWFIGWHERFGGRLSLAVAGWPAHASMNNSAGFRSYLSRLPKVGGAIVWDAAGTMPSYIVDALAEYQPGGSVAGTTLLANRARFSAPGPQLTASLGLVITMAIIFAGVRGRS